MWLIMRMIGFREYSKWIEKVPQFILKTVGRRCMRRGTFKVIIDNRWSDLIVGIDIFSVRQVEGIF